MPVCGEIPCKSACQKVKSSRLPFHWDLNLYRGCTHGCRYCYAIYSHQFLEGGGSYFSTVYRKENLPQVLERQLSSPAWKGEIINLGGVTDSYQPVEGELGTMREVLKILIRHRNPCILSSKSALVLRDMDLWEELAAHTFVGIAQTITTVDESLRRLLEPGAAPSAERFRVLSEFSHTKAVTGLHIMPILPHLTDSAENLSGLIAGARESGVRYLLPGTLYLREPTRRCFLGFLEEQLPDLLPAYETLYRGGGLDRGYKSWLHRERLGPLLRKSGLSTDYHSQMARRLEETENTQLSLFG